MSRNLTVDANDPDSVSKWFTTTFDYLWHVSRTRMIVKEDIVSLLSRTHGFHIHMAGGQKRTIAHHIAMLSNAEEECFILLDEMGAKWEEKASFSLTPLMTAVKHCSVRSNHGSKETPPDNNIKFLVETKKVSINECDFFQSTPIMMACDKGNIALMKYLIWKGGSIHFSVANGWFPFRWNKNLTLDLEAVKLLVEHGVEWKKGFDNALHCAATYGHIDTLKYLIEEHHAEVDPVNKYGATPLVRAVEESQLETICFLVSQGAKMEHRIIENGETVLGRACAKRLHSATRCLLELGADVEILNYGGFDLDTYGPLLQHLCRDRRLPLDVIISFLVHHCFEVDLPHPNWGTTALYYAISNGRLDITRLLIENGADVHHTDRDGDTPLTKYRFTSDNGVEITRILFEHGANLNHSGALGRTALHYAVNRGDFETVRFLIDNGSTSTNKLCETGYTPFSLAMSDDCCGFHLKIAKYLLGRKIVDIEAGAKCRTGSPLHVACECHYAEKAVILLIENGANVESRKVDDGSTPLMTVLKKFDDEEGDDCNDDTCRGSDPEHDKALDIVKSLVEKGKANIVAQNKQGQTAIDIAAEKKLHAIHEYLIKEQIHRLRKLVGFLVEEKIVLYSSAKRKPCA